MVFGVEPGLKYTLNIKTLQKEKMWRKKMLCYCMTWRVFDIVRMFFFSMGMSLVLVQHELQTTQLLLNLSLFVAVCMQCSMRWPSRRRTSSFISADGSGMPSRIRYSGGGRLLYHSAGANYTDFSHTCLSKLRTCKYNHKLSPKNLMTLICLFYHMIPRFSSSYKKDILMFNEQMLTSCY